MRALVTTVLLVILALAVGTQLAEGGTENDILIHVNQSRVDAGLRPLTWRGDLTLAELGHLGYLTEFDLFQHEGNGGSMPWDRAMDRGYGSPYVGEVLARGYEEPHLLIAAWLESPSHRAVLLNPLFDEAGVAAVRDGRGRLYTGVLLGGMNEGE